MRGRFAGLSEEQIIKLAQENDKQAMEYLIKKNIDIVYAKAKVFYIKGLDKDDVIQEGMVGLYKAIRDYEVSKEVSFRGFAHICVYRHLISAIKTANRQKHIPLNTFMSIDKQLTYGQDDGEGRTLQEIIPDEKIDPEREIINRESVQELYVALKDMLTPLEWKVFTGFLENKSYQEISEELSINIKTVDNALQRARRKVNEVRYRMKNENLQQTF